ncbi:MAG: glycoside hydrolase family 16 protein [Bacteroidota bacterium]
MNFPRTFKSCLMGLLAVVVTGTLNSCIQQEELGICEFPQSLDAYTLVWADEFDGAEVDTTKWNLLEGDGTEFGIPGWGNNELQWYTDSSRNASISNGNLVITARQEALPGTGKQYTSARLTTQYKGDWKYGRMDIRAKMPIGQGMWPAIWMLPSDTVYGRWPKSGEIDIMELTGDKPDKIFSTIHFGHDSWRFIGEDYFLEPGRTFADTFHVYTCLWNEDCLKFYVDGEPVNAGFTPSTTLPTTWPFRERFHMILNIAVGGNLPGSPDNTTRFPQTMEVDYVRVYQEN